MLRIGEALLDPESRRLFVGADERRLSPKANAVLLALAEEPRQVWTRDALLERVWPAVNVGEEVLTQAIAELRRAFQDDFRAPLYVGTVHKGGYRLLAPVRPHEADDAGRVRDAGALPSLEAYARYLQAAELYERGGRQNTQRAILAFEAILRDEPAFALAHTGLAKALSFFSIYYAPNEGDLPRALEHSRIARRLDAASAEAFAAEGLIHAITGDRGRSSQCFSAALALDPQSAETHYIVGRACLTARDFASAEALFVRAAKLRADDYHSLLLASKARQRRGDVPGARAICAAALPRIDAVLAGRPEDHRALCDMARALLHLGRAPQAEALMEIVSRHADPLNYYLACTYAAAGEHGRALDVLEEIVELGWRHASWLHCDPDFDQVRSDPRFTRLAAAIA